ncbi:hypothetical protein H0H93_008214 [Arthromyces matolae]|nr:hypothetical protein H0H93_008214 [Arthromyces matolae]
MRATASISKRSHDHDPFTLPNSISARHLGDDADSKTGSGSSDIGQGTSSLSKYKNKKRRLSPGNESDDAAAKRPKAAPTSHSNNHPVQDAINWSSTNGKRLETGCFGEVWTTMYKDKQAVIKIVPFGRDRASMEKIMKNELFCTEMVGQLLDAGESDDAGYLIMPSTEGLTYDDAKANLHLTDERSKEAMETASTKMGKKYGVWQL